MEEEEFLLRSCGIQKRKFPGCGALSLDSLEQGRPGDPERAGNKDSMSRKVGRRGKNKELKLLLRNLGEATEHREETKAAGI